MKLAAGRCQGACSAFLSLPRFPSFFPVDYRCFPRLQSAKLTVSEPVPGCVPRLSTVLSVKAEIIQPPGCWQNPNEACIHQEASPRLSLQNKPL